MRFQPPPRVILLSVLLFVLALTATATKYRLELQVFPSDSRALPFDPGWEKPEPVVSELKGVEGICPADGAGEDVVLSRRKNRVDQANAYHDVDLRNLSILAIPEVPTNRRHWKPDDIQEVAKLEGVAVRVMGYVSKVKVQARGFGEAANCFFTKDEDVDWHVWLSDIAKDKESHSVITETTPRVRATHPRWQVGVLDSAVLLKERVRISGWLLLDQKHRSQVGLNRSTIWEIHPITKIEISKDGTWIDMDDPR